MVAPLRSEVRPEHYKDPRNMRGNSYAARDKSGYIIPDPEDLYERLYAKFPHMAHSKVSKLIAQLEEYYGIISECNNTIFDDIDIRKGVGYNLNSDTTRRINLFNDTVRYYSNVYNDVEKLSDTQFSSTELSELISSVKSLGDRIDKLVTALNR